MVHGWAFGIVLPQKGTKGTKLERSTTESGVSRRWTQIDADVLNAECRMQNAECRMQNAKSFSVKSAKSAVKASRE
jgi:hypothetical protein